MADFRSHLLGPPRQGRAVDLTGQRFGKLVVEVRWGSTKDGTATWFCKCDCGKAKVVSRRSLKQGNVVSCGCVMRRYRKRKRKGATAKVTDKRPTVWDRL